MKRILLYILCIIPTLAGCSDFDFATPTHDLNGNTDDVFTNVVLWKNGDYVGTKSYANFRIPTMMRAKNALFAFCEGRQSTSSDSGDIDIICKKSTDNGTSWGAATVLLEDGVNTVGNPCGVYTKTGRIILMFNWQVNPSASELDFNSTLGVTWAQVAKHPRRVFYTYSDDEGSTWSKPTDLTSLLKKNDWGFCAVGPCHAIQVQTGAESGRIIVPYDHKEYVNKDTYYYSNVIWSDDNGDNWTLGPKSILYGNESSAVELSDGRIFLDMRNANSDEYKCRAYVISKDGGETWGNLVYDTDRPEPTPTSLATRGCQGSIINYTTTGVPGSTLLFSNPADATSRVKMTLRVSYDNGENWPKSIVINSGNSGYSDLAVFGDGSVGILYENGAASYKEQISYVRLTKSQLTSVFTELK